MVCAFLGARTWGEADMRASPARIAACLEQVGIAFLFAPAMHSAMKYVQAARRELRLPTVFNLLGPLANPAGARHQVMGVYEPRWVPVIGGVLAALGAVATHRVIRRLRPDRPDAALVGALALALSN